MRFGLAGADRVAARIQNQIIIGFCYLLLAFWRGRFVVRIRLTSLAGFGCRGAGFLWGWQCRRVVDRYPAGRKPFADFVGIRRIDLIKSRARADLSQGHLSVKVLLIYHRLFGGVWVG